jgi:hypothetical protein
VVPSNTPAAYQNNLRIVTVNLTWTSYFGKQVVTHTRQMQMQVARDGMQNYLWGK